VKIDLENINQRILALPIPARNYDRLVSGKTMRCICWKPTVDDGNASGHIVHKFDVCARKSIRCWIISAASSFPPMGEGTLRATAAEKSHGRWRR